MPQLNDVEVWDEAEENLLTTFEGLSAVCDAVSFAIAEENECSIFWFNGSEWLNFGGPRPKNPPGR